MFRTHVQHYYDFYAGSSSHGLIFRIPWTKSNPPKRNSVCPEDFITSRIIACWYQNVFQASFPPQYRLFFLCMQSEQDELERYVLDFHFVARWQAAPRQKKDDLYIFQIHGFSPVDFCPSKPLHCQMEAKKSIYSFILYTALNCPLLAISPLDYCPSWPFHCEMIAGLRPKIALLHCFAGNKAPAQMWHDIYHQYISNKVCNQYVLWTRNPNRHP